MTATLPKIIADFNTTTTASIAIGATTFTLTSATDDDGVSLPTGTYGLTIDRKNSNKEYIQCTITGTSVTNVKNVSRQGTLTSGFAKAHRKGAEVIISDFSVLKKMLDLLDGTTDLDSGTPLAYDGAPTFTPGSNEISTVKYADDLAIAGSPDATTSTKGIVKMSVAPVSAASPIAVGNNDPRLQVTNYVPNTYAADAGGTDTYAISIPNAPSSYATGQIFHFKANTANTGTATLNVNSLGAKTIVRSDGSTLLTGDILANQFVTVQYDGTNLVMTSSPANTVNLASSAYPAGDGTAITNVTGSMVETYPLGESFTGATTPQPAVIISDIKTTAPVHSTTSNSTMTQQFGRDGSLGSVEMIALKIIPRGTIIADNVKARIIKENSPTNNVLVEIQTDNSGSPSGTPITNGTSVAQAGSGFTSFDLRTFNFSSAFTLSAGTTYWVVFKTNIADNANYYSIQVLSGSNDTYASFSAKQYASSAWNATKLPIVEIVPTTSSTGSTSSLWLADANATSARFRNIDGLVTTTGSAGATGTINRVGRVGGFTNLTIGATYYLSTTAGNITSSLENIYGTALGKAYSATQIDLFNNIRVVGDTIVLAGNIGSTYRALVDGLYVGYQAGSGGVASIKTDTSSTPTTIRSYLGTNSSFSVPVRAGEYFTTAQVSPTPALVDCFIPLGRLE